MCNDARNIYIINGFHSSVKGKSNFTSKISKVYKLKFQKSKVQIENKTSFSLHNKKSSHKNNYFYAKI